MDLRLAVALAAGFEKELREGIIDVTVEDCAVVLVLDGHGEVYLDIDPELADDFREAFSLIREGRSC